jgi:hypothetical protein
MNIFSEIEGLSGENLTTAVLRLLLLRSQDIRDKFIRLISNESHVGPLTVGPHFSCFLEQTIEDEKSGRSGRLDLILETTDAVIGIENKLFAGFQEGQPHKYLSSLAKRAEGLMKLRGKKYQYLLLILAPKGRKGEIERLIETEHHQYIYVSWDDVLDALVGVQANLDPATKAMLLSFEEFLRDKISFIPQFVEWVPHLKRRFDDYGTPLQNEVVKKLWGFFPDSGPRLSYGKTSVGYYFCYSLKEYRAWYGFVRSSAIIESRPNKAELIIVTSFPVSLVPPAFSPVTLDGNFFGPKFKTYACVIEFDQTWASPEKWRNELEPLNKNFEKLKSSAEVVGVIDRGTPAEGV